MEESSDPKKVIIIPKFKSKLCSYFKSPLGGKIEDGPAFI